MMLTNYFSPMLHDTFDLQVDDLFDDAFRTVGGPTLGRHLPWNVYEKDDWFWIDVAVPGLTGKDVDLSIKDGILTMSVHHEMQDKDEGPDYYVREIGWGTVSRSMKLPGYIDADKATATSKDGILTIGFPKRAEALARQIPIEEHKAV